MRRVKKSNSCADAKFLFGSDLTLAHFRALTQLWHDQKGRCYICERYLTTDFEADHLQCRSEFPKLRDKWRNYFLACSYCNRKKCAGYNSLLRPDTEEISKEISQRWVPMENRFEIRSLGDTEAHHQTEQLLERVFNGKKWKYDFRHARFRQDIVLRLNRFCRHLLRVLQRDDKQSREILEQDLGAEAELLTLKHSLLRDVGLRDIG